MAPERGNSGQYVDTVTPTDVLGVFESVQGPVVTSADVADELECSRDTARRKLGQLYERGDVTRRKTAGRVVWWLSDEQRSRGGSAKPLRGLVGLFGDDEEAAANARERSEEWGKAFDQQMMSRADDLDGETEDPDEDEERA
jgi:predicted ArsR family transcriptional regulator